MSAHVSAADVEGVSLTPRRRGVLLEEGPPDEIFSSPKNPRTQQFLQRIIEAGRL